MDIAIRTVITEVTRASDAERITFPEVVKTLIAAGVERYHADFARAERVFYMPGGASETVGAHEVPAAAESFSADDVVAAIRAIQKGEIRYREFCARIAAAGCVGYHVFLEGRRAHYYGRSGDFHVEHFPGARP